MGHKQTQIDNLLLVPTMDALLYGASIKWPQRHIKAGPAYMAHARPTLPPLHSLDLPHPRIHDLDDRVHILSLVYSPNRSSPFF